MSEPKWIRLSTYAERYDVDRRTLLKWAEHGIVQIMRVQLKNQRAVVRIRNLPPSVSIHGSETT